MQERKVKANVPQGKFLNLPQKNKAFVGGFGTGKTWVNCQDSCIAYLKSPKVNQGYFAPTYTDVRTIYYPTMEEVAYSFGLNIHVRKGDREVDFFKGKRYLGTTFCRSLKEPSTIVGFKIGKANIDEIDKLPTDKAESAWRYILARMRDTSDTASNGVSASTTPEGFKFTHKMFVKMLEEKPYLKQTYGLIQASTYDNEENLPEGYIQSLIDIYPEQLIDAYLDGQFRNLTSGTVFYAFDRKTCGSKETIIKDEPLYIGMDFNVEHMAATVFVKRKDGSKTIWHAVDEFKDVFDTPQMIDILEDNYRSGDRKHSITIYPDSTGKNRKTVGASISDISLLTSARFKVLAKNTNPLVKDRIIATNKAFQNGLVKVNPNKCPRTTECLEQQAYADNGEPDKKSGFDHQNDATTYPIAYEMPVLKPVLNLNMRFA